MTEEELQYCIYDNPDTFRREAWQDGEMIAFITAELLQAKGFRPGWMMQRMMAAGQWKTGQIYGNESALRKEAP